MWKFYLRNTTILFLLLLILSPKLFAQEPHLSLTPVITGLTSPIQITNAGDGSNRLFIVLQGSSGTGTVIAYSETFVKLDTFLKVTNIATGGERGLLSLAFHPQYGNMASPFYGMFYVYYTNSNGDLEVARYKVSADPNIADPNSKDTVITIPHPVNSNHNGGTIRFGFDGYLYLATGDGGSADDPPNNAQNPNVLLGKMIRIDVTSADDPPFYTIPPDNPYVGVTTPDTLDAIYAMGLRNPFRWSFDRMTHDLWIGDVGQGSWEEIDFRPADSTAGVNYGWRCYEGNASHITSGCGPASNYTFPIFTYPNPGTSTAVTGGFVYRGTLPANASLVGYYLATDYYSGNFYKIRPGVGGNWTVYTQNAVRTGVPSFGEAENGEIFVASQFAGNISSIVVDAVLPLRLNGFSATKINDKVQLKWKTGFEENMSRFEVEYSLDGTYFQHAGLVMAMNKLLGADYLFLHDFRFSGKIFYRLKMINMDNSYEYSNIISVENDVNNLAFVQPTFITSGTMILFIDGSYNSFELMSMSGAIVMKKDINRRTGRVDFPVSTIVPGIYIACLRNNQSSVQQKVVIR